MPISFGPMTCSTAPGYRFVAVAGDDDRCRRIAVANVSVIGVDLDDDVFGHIDAAQGRNKRCF